MGLGYASNCARSSDLLKNTVKCSCPPFLKEKTETKKFQAAVAYLNWTSAPGLSNIDVCSSYYKENLIFTGTVEWKLAARIPLPFEVTYE